MGPLDQVLPAHPVLSQQLKLASDDWYVGKSEVAGQGVFAGKDYESGDRIGLAMTDGGENEFSAKIWNLTELARYCNHQNRNNVDIEKDGDRFHLVAIKPIGQDEELVSNYWQVARAKGPHSVMLYEGKQVPTSDLSDYVEKEAASRVRVAMPYGKGYLMEKMNNPKFPDNLGRVRFPGGGIDEGETAEEAAVREMQEELGITVDPARLRRLGIHPKGTYGPEQYFSYDDHGLEPGDYEAAVGGDKQIELLESGTDNPNFWGSKLDELQKEAAEDLQGFMDRSELMGSRGRALKYGRPEPEGRDYDRVVFTDAAEDQQALMKNLREVAKIKGYKQHERPDGFLTISGDNQDLSVYPTSKRDKIYNAWKLIEGGMSKDEAWDQIAKEAKDKVEFVHSCCGEPSGKCAGCSEGSVLTLKDEYEPA